MRSLKWLSMFIVVVGCASTEEGMQRVRNRFVGKNIDEFVLAHGIPYAKHQLNDGGYVYLWSSGVESYQMPTTTTYRGSSSQYGHRGYATTTPGTTIEMFCEVQIHTTADGKIVSMAAVKDTWGEWTTSRCAEIFK